MNVSTRFSLPLLGWLAVTPALHAQAPAREAVVLEPVHVTGSHLQRTEEEKVLPVTVLDNALISTRDAAQPSDLLTALPMVTGLPLNDTATLGAQARGDHAAISLRGLPSSNTLILLDG